MRPKVSVAMATYNGEQYIKEQINSILDNLNDNDEIVISDDGSTDNTIKIIEDFNDKRIKIIDGPKKGVKQNFANAIKNAVGKYIFLSDQDDIWAKNKVNKVLEIFQKEKVTLVIHDAEIVNEHLDVIEESFFKYRNSGKGIIKNVWKNTYIGCCMAFENTIKNEILPIPDEIEMHDQWIGIINEKYGKSFFLSEKLIKYRRHEKNVSKMHHYGIKKMLTNRINLIKKIKDREITIKNKRFDTEIFVAAHKKANITSKYGYIPIQVGASLHDEIGYLKDNEGENISEKNPSYCELTAIYWIWKNAKSKVVGLVHYRRYFFKRIYYKNLTEVLDIEKINDILNKYDAIVPKQYYMYKYNVEEQYGMIHNINDLNKCRKIIQEKSPEYLDAFDRILKHKYYYPYNMCIMKKELFDNYCEWLFNILFALEKEIDTREYSDYNKRIYGFLSERLFNVWLEKNKNIKCKEVYVNNIEGKPLKENLKNTLKKITIKNERKQ